MRSKEFIIICSILLFAGLFISIYLLQRDQSYPMDTVAVNNIVKQTEQNWEQLASYYENKVEDIKYDFTVIDTKGSVRYSTLENHSASYRDRLNAAIKNRDLMIDLIVNEEVIGKLMIKNDAASLIEKEKETVLQSMIICFLVIAAIIIFYYIYLVKNIFRPFQGLKQFAVRVATGNLDAPINMDKKNVFGAFTESFDLMREALKSARYNEYQANKSKKELVASLSHDIKNPVASIKAICEAMELKSSDRHIHTIWQKAEQIDTLISDMFQATLEELGELKVNVDEYSSEIIMDILEDAAFYHNIHIVSKLPKCLILCDKLRLTQIIDNILANAHKYAASDVNISFEQKGSNFQICFKDFGKGIAEEELPLIWEKYFRGNNAQGKEGAGLGLYLSKVFIEKMGGQIECLNEADGFMVKLELKYAGILTTKPNANIPSLDDDILLRSYNKDNHYLNYLE